MRRRRVAVFLVILATLVVCVTPLFTRTPYLGAVDFSVWGDDWLKLSDCIGREEVACQTAGISKFPLGYLLNSYYATDMRAHRVEPAWAIGWLNTLFLALPIVFVILIRGRRAALPLSLVYVVAIFLTALPPFYLFGALEVQSGVVIGLFLSSLVLLQASVAPPRASVLSAFLFLSAFLVPFFKDTNTVVLIVGLAVAGTTAWLARNDPDPAFVRSRRRVWVLIAALGAGAVVTFTYNFIKGGSVLPLLYLDEAAQTSPRPAKVLEFLVATWFSPNGGVIVFWAGALWATVWLLRELDYEVSRAGAFVALAAALVYSVVVSCWWAPFGWDSWGDRLMLPVMLGTVICLTTTARERSPGRRDPASRGETSPSPSPRRRPAQMMVDGAIIVIVTLSFHYTFLSYYGNKNAMWMASLFGGPRCNRMGRDLGPGEASMGLGFWRSDSYYACARERFLHVPVYIADQPKP